MDFASSHVYLGDDEENEVDDEVLQSVEASGGLLQAVAMAQQQQQAQAQPAGVMQQQQPSPFEAMLEQQRAAKEGKRASVAGMSDESLARDSQLTALAKSHPNQRVLLLTFNGEVTIIGDGSAGSSVVIAGDKLTQEAELQRIGREYAVCRPISQSREELSAALFSLEETGPTALGPALVTAISIASRQRGSTVLVCTDGLANVGVGSMSDKSLSQEQLESWYQARGVEAREAGVTVSVLSIKGDECRLEALGLVAAETLGQVQRVDPTNLVDNFAAILQNPVIATQVAVTFFLHKGMQFRGAEVDVVHLLRYSRRVSSAVLRVPSILVLGSIFLLSLRSSSIDLLICVIQTRREATNSGRELSRAGGA